MGLLDKITDITNSLGREKNVNQGMLDGIVDIFKKDGLGGIVDSFTNSGLGDTISSWIGSGSNLPVSIDQIKEALGSEKLKELAGRAGESVENSSNFLKDLLPDIIDKITPDGKIEADDSEF